MITAADASTKLARGPLVTLAPLFFLKQKMHQADEEVVSSRAPLITPDSVHI